jgi:oxygen-independent coproporphyrinogen-3 oxidase
VTTRTITVASLRVLQDEPELRAGEEELVSYAYSYPHKSSYRPLVPPVPLAEAWAGEDTRRLALYVHLPFCEMRCGFCNLFTRSQPDAEEVAHYLDALHRQIRVVADLLPTSRFALCALGGGTPTCLAPPQLEQLFERLHAAWGFDPQATPTSVETSPATASPDHLRMLARLGVHRVSLGVQSFVEEECRALGRPQRLADVRAALDAIRASNVAALNVDLIYGHPSQTLAGWQVSLREALRYQPEEIYLYPLYVRPHTGLARRVHGGAPPRLDLYRMGRETLLAAGYNQVSHRCFRRAGYRAPAAAYACQQDGMLGLGCGARSYTRRLHYGTRFAVTQAEIRAILHEWLAQDDASLSLAHHGCWLSEEEQRRRYVILSVLEAQGLSPAEYQARFGSDAWEDLPELNRLAERGWLILREGRLVLTERGLERADWVGPALYSSEVRTRLREFVRL